MHRAGSLLLVAAICVLLVPGAAAIALTIDATPAEPRVGEIVTISGTVTGIRTIAVYLFVTGPGLDPGGASLENLNIPTGRGLFTTAPVNMENGTWTYTWDTSVILGTLKPGNYTVHVVASPVERVRFNEGESAATQIMFRPPLLNPAETPLDPALALAACVVAGMLVLCAGIRRA